jgi:hypothetical protein
MRAPPPLDATAAALGADSGLGVADPAWVVLSSPPVVVSDMVGSKCGSGGIAVFIA